MTETQAFPDIRQDANLDGFSADSRLSVLYAGAALRAPYSTEAKWQVERATLAAVAERLAGAGYGGDVDLAVADQDGDEDRLLGRSDPRAGCLAFLRLGHGSLRVQACGPSRAAVEALVAVLREGFPEINPQAAGAVWMQFWYYGPRGPEQVKRRIAVPPWADVAANYAPGVRRAMDGVRGWHRVEGSGQLLLWHGPPGTGKTYAIRALTWEWREWCRFHYIADPDQFFGKHADYLMQVLLDEDAPFDDEEDGNDAKPTAPPWRLLILEDAGEFLMLDARERSGQGFARFLNTVDGLLGQGLRLLLLISSNEDLGKLHPAVTRPGRCASRIEFKPFSSAEAAAWLAARGDGHATPTKATLAELYAQVAGRTTDKVAAPGFAPPRELGRS